MTETICNVVHGNGFGEIIEKKSRFLASVKGVKSEEEALTYIKELKKQYWDASHNCYAYVIGDKQEIQRYSDDGEPQGTAGRPILEVLLGENMIDTVIIVTRYFGGTLLGTGGLIRAYRSAALEGLQKSTVLEKKRGKLLELALAYSEIGKIQYILEQHDIPVLDTQYTEAVRIKALPTIKQAEPLIQKLIEETGGTIEIVEKEEVYFLQGEDNQIVILV